MFLSDRDIKYAIESNKLIVNPIPKDYDENSIDLHLGDIESARIWDTAAAVSAQADAGRSIKAHVLELGSFDYKRFAANCLVPVPDEPSDPDAAERMKVFRRGNEVILRPLGFMLWMTKEEVGTPEANPELIAFVNAKSTKARTGIMVHFTAPTINSGWKGKITLEIINLGPFNFALRPNDAIAQLTVATISSRPDPQLRTKKSATSGQVDPSGTPDKKRTPKGRNK